MSASKKDCRARADNGKDPIKSELFDPVFQFGDSAHRSSFPSIISKETATRSYQRNFFQKTTADLPPSRGARKAVTFSSVRVRAAASRGAFCRFALGKQLRSGITFADNVLARPAADALKKRIVSSGSSVTPVPYGSSPTLSRSFWLAHEK